MLRTFTMLLRTSVKRTSYATWLLTVLSIVTNYGASALPKTIAEAVLQKQLRIILKDCQDNPTWKPLHAAAYRGYVQAGSKLLKQADPNLLTDKGTPPLVFAAQGGHYTFVSLLLKAGAKINLAGKEFTALMMAAGNGHVDIVRLLCPPCKCINSLSTAELLAVANGNCAKTEQKNNKKETALYCAALSGQTEAVTALLNAGAEHHVLAANGSTPLSTAIVAKKPRIVARLLSCYLSDPETLDRGTYLSGVLKKLGSNSENQDPESIIEFLKAGISATWEKSPAFVSTAQYEAAYQKYENSLSSLRDQDAQRLLLAFTGWPFPDKDA